jgi:hypothetical protein
MHERVWLSIEDLRGTSSVAVGALVFAVAAATYGCHPFVGRFFPQSTSWKQVLPATRRALWVQLRLWLPSPELPQ